MSCQIFQLVYYLYNAAGKVLQGFGRESRVKVFVIAVQPIIQCSSIGNDLKLFWLNFFTWRKLFRAERPRILADRMNAGRLVCRARWAVYRR